VKRLGATRLKSEHMRSAGFIIAVALGLVTAALAPSGLAGEESAPPVTCGSGVPGGVNCVVSKKDGKRAHEAYARAIKLQRHKQLEAAFKEFDEASRLLPQDLQFVTARELVKSQLVFAHVERGNTLLAQNSAKQAAEEFRAALDLDPENQFARQRLEESMRPGLWPLPPAMPSRLSYAGEIHLEPKPDLATFHYRGDVRGLFSDLGMAYGVKAQFDDSVPNRQVVFNVDDVDFFTALKLACVVSKVMWSALDAHQILLAADNPENHKQFDRMSLATFTLPAHSTAQEVTEVVTTLRTLFDLRFVSPGQTAGKVEVRAPRPILDACATLLAQLDNQRPQVMLDVQVFQISHQMTRDIGVHIPNTFNMFNIPAAALAALGGQNIQDLINQLIASGGINQAGSTALSGLLAQLGGQQNSIFSQPLATFGGGLTFMGLSLDHLSASLSLNESWARSLEHLTMRASQGNDATFHLGSRYPILNASYAPIFNSPQIAQVLGNQSYVPPFPSVSYEDLGLNLKAKPTVHSDGAVSLQLELQVRSLTGQSANGVPVISNREYKGSINLKDGEPAVVAGEMSRTDTISMSGIPGLGAVPLINQAMVSNTKEEDEDELMVVITPHILSDINRVTPEIWISQR
jgi:general secretion pathway protein D